MTINNGEPAVIHYGTKGMKWGVRKPTNGEITDARLRVIGENVKLQQNVRSVKNSGVSRSEKKAAIREIKTEALANPDRLTAMKLTTGEKYAMTGVALFAPPAAVGYAVSRGIETAAVKNALVKKASQ